MCHRCGSFAAWSAALLCAAAGCGGGEGLVPVRGTVTLDGQPVEGAAIQFVPDGDKARPAFAESQSGGSYELTTRTPGDGAVPGSYRVVVVWEAPPPPMFRPPNEAGPSRQEMQKALEQYQAKQKKAGKGPNIPAVYADPGKTPLRVQVPAPGGRADLTLSSKP